MMRASRLNAWHMQITLETYISRYVHAKMKQMPHMTNKETDAKKMAILSTATALLVTLISVSMTQKLISIKLLRSVNKMSLFR
jgi:hypothetical protein